MGPNLIIVPLMALIPMVMGFIWYHPKVAGSFWMKHSGMTQEKIESTSGKRMAMILITAYIFALMASFSLIAIANHQYGIFSLFVSEPDFFEPNSASQQAFQQVLATMDIGKKHLGFGHGALHGTITTLFLVLPIIGTNAMFERKSWKYVLVHVAYWGISFALAGGVAGQWGWNAG